MGNMFTSALTCSSEEITKWTNMVWFQDFNLIKLAFVLTCNRIYIALLYYNSAKSYEEVKT